MKGKLYFENKFTQIKREILLRAGCYRSQCSQTALEHCWFSKEETANEGVDVHGYFLSEIGLGESVRSIYLALKLQNVPVSAWNRMLSGRANAFPFEAKETRPTYSTSLSVGGYKSIKKIAKAIYRNKINNTYPFWELEEWPPSIINALKRFDAVWAPSNFLPEGLQATGIENAALGKQPTSIRGVPNFSKSSNHGLQILFFYDFKSGIKRKNSDTCVDAFQKTFPTEADVHLTIKVMGEKDPGERRWLNALAANDSRITIIDKIHARDEIEQLTSDQDVFTSLHRSEGVGLGCAETLFMGKIMTASDCSGTINFVNQDPAYPVKWKKQFSEASDYTYVS